MGRAEGGLQDGFVPQRAYGGGVGGLHGGGGARGGFPGVDEGGHEGLPGCVGVGGLGGVDGCLGVGVEFWPDVADVVALGAVVLSRDLSAMEEGVK